MHSKPEKKQAGQGVTAMGKWRIALLFMGLLFFFFSAFMGLHLLWGEAGETPAFQQGGISNGTVNAESPGDAEEPDIDRINIMLLGISANLADTVMVGSYDLKHQKLDIISVPRDTYYPRAGHAGAGNKLNAIYGSSDGGIQETAKAVSSILGGVEIEYYIQIDYKGIAEIVDAIGGVKFNVPFHMKYDDSTPGAELHIDIPAGEQLITGENAEELLRFRQTNPWHRARGYQDYGTMDIGRVKTQQEFVKAAIRQSLTLNLPNVMKTVFENVETNLNLRTVLKLAERAVALKPEFINSVTLPGTSTMMEGTSVWILNQQEVEGILEGIFQRDENQYLSPEEEGTAQSST